MKYFLILFFAISFLGFSQDSFLKPKKDNIELQAFKRSFDESIFVDKKQVKPGDSFSVVIELQMIDEWYTYWKTSGGIGFPMEFKVSTPDGITLKNTNYPYPKYSFDESVGAATFKNYGNLIYTIDFDVDKDSTLGDKNIELIISWQACKIQCIQPLGELPLRMIPIKVADSSEADPAITAIKEKGVKSHPVDAPEGWKLHGFLTKKSYKAQYEDKATEQAAVVATISAPGILNPVKMQFFPGDQAMAAQANHYSMTSLNDNSVQKIIEYNPTADVIKEISGVITIKDGDKTIAYKISGPLSDKEYVPAVSDNKDSKNYRTLGGGEAKKEDKGLLLNILLAFAGGFILNLMPCVFPVLSIKVMGFVKHAEAGKHKAIQHALVFTFGALLSFWILAGAMLGLKSASSEAVNWGFQLQEPKVVLVLILVLYVMALNLFGLFEIGVGLTSAGQSVQGKSGFTGSFLSGILATVVATPCMAPMLGAALTYALTQPNYIAMIVFTFIALGMCSPYVFLAAFPKFLKMIPKPGPWMETFKQAMGFAMMLAVVWLMETLQKQLEYPPYFFNILWGFILITIGFWIYGKYTPMYLEKKTRIKGFIATGLICAVGFWYSYTKLTDKPEIEWNDYNIQEIEKKLAEGTPVFIDFTASWCASCQVNKKVAMYPNAALFLKKGVYTVRADYTKKDPKLADILGKYDSAGVPLNLLFDGKNPKPVKFPELYSKEVLTQQLEKLDSK